MIRTEYGIDPALPLEERALMFFVINKYLFEGKARNNKTRHPSTLIPFFFEGVTDTVLYDNITRRFTEIRLTVTDGDVFTVKEFTGGFSDKIKTVVVKIPEHLQ